jgi:hypothetical protein
MRFALHFGKRLAVRFRWNDETGVYLLRIHRSIRCKIDKSGENKSLRMGPAEISAGMWWQWDKIL